MPSSSTFWVPPMGVSFASSKMAPAGSKATAPASVASELFIFRQTAPAAAAVAFLGAGVRPASMKKSLILTRSTVVETPVVFCPSMKSTKPTPSAKSPSGREIQPRYHY